jgi:hypothetical protein
VDEDVKRWLYWAIPVVVVIGAGVALYYNRTHNQPETAPVAQTEAPPAVAPPVQHPIEEVADEKPLPALAESDAQVQDSLVGALGRSIEQVLVRRTSSVTSSSRSTTCAQEDGGAVVAGEADRRRAGGSTGRRADTQSRQCRALRAVHQHREECRRRAGRVHVSAFLSAVPAGVRRPGLPDGYFNDRLVEVIDHLLATPDIAGPIKLTQPSVYYQFADPSIEERSAGQKAMIRLGSKNAAIVKENCARYVRKS